MIGQYTWLEGEVNKRIQRPITISPELAARCDGNDRTERMGKAFRAVLKTPHSAVMKDTAKRKRERDKPGKH